MVEMYVGLHDCFRGMTSRTDAQPEARGTQLLRSALVGRGWVRDKSGSRCQPVAISGAILKDRSLGSCEWPKKDVAELADALDLGSFAHDGISPRFATTPGLNLEVTIEVPIAREQAQSKADEARAGLKELGLDSDVTLG